MHPLGSGREAPHPAPSSGSVDTSLGRGRRRARLAGYGLAAAGGCVLLSGCSTADLPRIGMPVPITDSGRRILFLWQGSWVAALVIGAFVWTLILYAAFRFRKRSDALPVQSRYNIPIEILYTVVPLIIISVLFFFTARDESTIMKHPKNAPQHTIDVTGIRWSWQFHYADAGNTPASTVTGTPGRLPVLYLPLGERVRFMVRSNDVDHSFWIPAFLFKIDAIPGRVNSFDVTPVRAGTYIGECAELCGTYHSRMRFTVKVVSAADYQSYVSTLKGGSAQ